MTALFWIFAIIGVALLGMVILPRGRYYLWGWNIMLVLVVAYFGLYKLTGTPRSACMLSSLGGLSGDYQIMHHTEVPHKAIYLLLQVDDAPLLVETRWSKGREYSLRKAEMQANKDASVLMVRAELLSECGPDKATEDADRDTDEGVQNQILDGRKGQNAPKYGTEGGEPEFYAKPVEADPLKTPPRHSLIEVH